MSFFPRCVLLPLSLSGRFCYSYSRRPYSGVLCETAWVVRLYIPPTPVYTITCRYYRCGSLDVSAQHQRSCVMSDHRVLAFCLCKRHMYSNSTIARAPEEADHLDSGWEGGVSYGSVSASYVRGYRLAPSDFRILAMIHLRCTNARKSNYWLLETGIKTSQYEHSCQS